MKKVLLFSLALVATAAISSCKKDRTCTCTSEISGTLNLTVSADTLLVDMSKSDAVAKCESFNSSFTDGNETVETTCELK
jgi:hypothetical protein